MIHFLHQVIEWYANGANWRGSSGIPYLLGNTLLLVFLSVAIAIAIAVPLGVWLGHRRRGSFIVINIANIGRALPALAVLMVTVEWLGIGEKPAIITLVALSIPPVLTNAYTAVVEVDPEVTDAARGMGMSGLQMLWRVELPSAIPLLFAGIRTAAVQCVATVTIASVVAVNNLGTLIYTGYSSANGNVELFAGSLLVIALTLLTELALSRLQRAFTPAGLKARPERPQDPAVTGVM